MASFTCPECGETFEQRSRLERHLATSHPPRAPSAADVEEALAGIDLPAGRDGLVEHASGRADPEVVEVLRELPDRRYRDAAEVARALGEIRRHEEKPGHQPSERGGERALEAPSAARMASLFEGMEFPATGEELRDHARERASEEEMEILERFEDGPYQDMADVARELGRRRG